MTESGDIGGVRHGLVHGFEAIVVETPAATAAVSLFGGQILSFVPAGHDEVLWVSPLVAAPPTPIRGGIPVCWPYFAREGQSDDVPSHGYARTARWALTGSRTTENGDTELELAPEGLDHLDLTVHMTVRVGATLTQGLHTHNPRLAAVTMTEAFHNYFKVADVRRVHVEGLRELTYIDKFDDMRTHTQDGNWSLPEDSGRSDRVYPDAGGTYRIIDPGLRRSVEVTARGGRSAVVWNPGEASASGMADVGSHWREFVCVEAANVGPNRVDVPAGSDHSLWQTISVTQIH
ncbi:D-hexose-6-phosphate mutarotase [Gordonia sp. LSe1-13]|uniref:Putative glucose-6-phosphate 1-epimerase n=1 Tax=Gordonia sesuvii TaxID=3116777 RepID=A0ABU7MAR5_9ACTN|nr:D-hexose-6-phosphate mutarotase [Gordonia sp. LSe1-13]